MSDTGLVALMFLASLAGFSAGAYLEKQQTIQMINQCEAALPRDQHCKLIAVPEKEE